MTARAGEIENSSNPKTSHGSAPLPAGQCFSSGGPDKPAERGATRSRNMIR
jgi:hypothetical protein